MKYFSTKNMRQDLNDYETMHKRIADRQADRAGV